MFKSTLMSLAFLCAFSAVSPAAEPDRHAALVVENGLLGQWTGLMVVGPKEYPINLWFEGGQTMTGRIELIGVTSPNNPLTDISISQNRVSFELASRPPQRFRGELRDDAISGTIDIAGMMATFSVQKILK